MEIQNDDKNYLQAVQALDKLIAKIKPETSTKMKSAIVALFTGDAQNPLRYSEKIGILHLDKDRKLKTNFFRFYDLQSLILLFEVELYYGFDTQYRKINDVLYAFDYINQGIISFQFRNKMDAGLMEMKVLSQCCKLQQFKSIQSKQIVKEDKKKNKGMFSRFKETVGSYIFQQPVIQVQEQSKVITVQKTKSITYDAKTGILNTQNLPPQWEQLFRKINLTKQQLKDQQIGKIIMEETITHHMKMKENGQQLGQIKQNNQKQHISQQVQLQQQLTQYKHPEQKQQRGRMDLMEEIRNNKVVLKPVKDKKEEYKLDVSSFNRQQRNDFAQHLRKKLEKRRIALNRRDSQQ